MNYPDASFFHGAHFVHVAAWQKQEREGTPSPSACPIEKERPPQPGLERLLISPANAGSQTAA